MPTFTRDFSNKISPEEKDISQGLYINYRITFSDVGESFGNKEGVGSNKKHFVIQPN